MIRRTVSRLPLAFALLGGCFTTSAVEDSPAPYEPPSDFDGPAGHWSDGGSTDKPIVVYGYEFKTAAIRNGYSESGDLCVIYATVEFIAPVDELIRFQARITMTNGAYVQSDVWENDDAGSRQYIFEFDTSGQGCWGSRRHYAENLRVAACREEACAPDLR